MRSAFSAPRTTHIEISYAATGLFVLKSCRFAGTWSRPGVAMLLTGNVGVPSLRARRLLQMCKPLSKDTPHKVINSGACGSAAPAFVNRAARRRDLSALIPSRNTLAGGTRSRVPPRGGAMLTLLRVPF